MALRCTMAVCRACVAKMMTSPLVRLRLVTMLPQRHPLRQPVQYQPSGQLQGCDAYSWVQAGTGSPSADPVLWRLIPGDRQ
eukprot:gene56668-biopygen37915